jgi:hypothetical protein
VQAVGPRGFASRACARYNGNSTVIASDPSWNLMLVLPLAVRTVTLIVRSFHENGRPLGPIRQPSESGRIGPLKLLPHNAGRLALRGRSSYHLNISN